MKFLMRYYTAMVFTKVGLGKYLTYAWATIDNSQAYMTNGHMQWSPIFTYFAPAFVEATIEILFMTALICLIQDGLFFFGLRAIRKAFR